MHYVRTIWNIKDVCDCSVLEEQLSLGLFYIQSNSKVLCIIRTDTTKVWNTVTFADSLTISSTVCTYQVSPLAESNDYHISKTQRFIKSSKTVVRSYIHDTTYARETQEMTTNPFRNLDPWHHDMARLQVVDGKEGLQTWRAAANTCILNKQQKTTE